MAPDPPPRPDHDERARELAATALRIVDAEGIGALTMRRLAREASIGPMTLYWYFADKQAVIDTMLRLVDAEMAAERAPDPPGGQPPAIEWLEELFGRAVRVLTRHHPDITLLIQANSSGGSSDWITEQALGNYEIALGHLAELGVTGVAAVETAFLISQGVYMLALACRRGADGEGSPEERMRAQWASLRDVAPDRYPRIRAAAEQFAGEPAAPSLLPRGIELFTSALVPGPER